MPPICRMPFLPVLRRRLAVAALVMALLAACGPLAQDDRPTREAATPVSSPLPPSLTPTETRPTPAETRLTPTPAPAATATATLTPSATPTPEPTATHTPIVTPRPVRAELITHGSRELPYVALTFDLCQKPEYPAGFDQGIVEALLAADAPATFFMGGDWARTHPAEARQLATYVQFEIGNHSWTHPDLIDLKTAAEISEQVTWAQTLIHSFTGRTPRLFRLPAGLYNDGVLRVIAQAGLYTIQWDVVTADPVPDNQADNINRIVREQVQNGSIIIMHANGRGWHTAEALPEMIRYLREQGYTLVTVSQLLGLEPLP
jgi:peptidoglycan-N-acetylglucosamine deacetylase